LAGWVKLPSGFRSSPVEGLIPRGVVLEVMKSGRVELDPEVHTALSIQAAKRGITLKAYVHDLLLPAVEITTWEFMGVNPEVKTASGGAAAKSIKPKVTKASLTRPRLADNPAALEEVARMARAGASLRAIGEAVGYPKATVAENLKRMRAREAAGERDGLSRLRERDESDDESIKR